jgi:hypothetical protein
VGDQVIAAHLGAQGASARGSAPDDVERGGRLVGDQQLLVAAQRHGDHTRWRMPPELVRVSPSRCWCRNAHLAITPIARVRPARSWVSVALDRLDDWSPTVKAD